MTQSLIELVRILIDPPVLAHLIGALLVLLGLTVYTSVSNHRLRREVAAISKAFGERLTELERAIGEIDPSMRQRRNESLKSVLSSLLSYSEAIRPGADHEQHEHPTEEAV